MRIIREKDFHMDNRTVVTFGKFDGIHKGHQKLLNEAKRLSKTGGMPLVAFTFRVRDGFSYDYMDTEVINTFEERERIFERLGVDILIEYPFDDEMAGLEPIPFLEMMVKDKLNAAYVVVGDDWSFGHMGQGNAELLKASQKLFDFEAVVLEKEMYEGRAIASTFIREEIRQGRMETVNILLNYPYSIAGRVLHGKALGRTIDVPTVNIIPGEGKILPPYGVYSARVRVGNREFYGVSNVGVRPTVDDGNAVSVETNIFDFDEDIYDETIEVELMHFQRPEMKFESVDTLKTQLFRDIEYAKTFFCLISQN